MYVIGDFFLYVKVLICDYYRWIKYGGKINFCKKKINFNNIYVVISMLWFDMVGYEIDN